MRDQQIANLLDLSGQVAIITGASRGIGRAMAEVFYRAGARVTLVARTSEPLEATAAHLQGNGPAEKEGPAVLAVPADVAVEAQVDRFVQRTIKTWGQVDILINNAALLGAGSIEEVAPADWERLIAANLTGTYLCSRAVVPWMKQRKYGRIINISSITAQTGGISGGVHYSASKGGMLSMTKTLARDLAPFGITVNAIAPGQIDTAPERLAPETRARLEGLIPLGRLGDPVDIAYAALFLASPMAAYITGATVDVNGGILKR